jgi:nucleotide-binding universal stress UspA family protein
MQQNARIVLVPVDFSEQSLIALEQAVSLSTYFHTKVVILHITEKGNSEEMISEMDELAKKYQRPDVSVEIMIRHGAVDVQINKAAAELNAVFIVMGVSSGSRFKRRLIGATALSVVRESVVPLITIKGKHHRVGCSNIVLPLDLSVETTQKVDMAIEFAKLGACHIRLMSVLFSTDDDSVGKLIKQMEDVRTIIIENKIECTAEMVKAIKGEETTAQVIIDYAHKVEADLIMIMTQQESAIKERLLGSTAEEIIMNSEVPVLSVIPQR